MPITTPDPSLYHGDGEHFLHVLEHLFVPAVEAAGMVPIKPMAQGADVIQGEIIKHLEKADLVLCDISTLNANVFFEMGIRTALNKPLCIVRDQHTPRIPFDTTIVNHHTYQGTLQPWLLQSEINSLSTHLQKSLDKSEGKNRLWSYFGLTMRAEPSESGVDSNSHLALISQQLEIMTRRIEDSASVAARVREALPRVTKRLLFTKSNPITEADSSVEYAKKLGRENAIEILAKYGVTPVEVNADSVTLELFLPYDPNVVLKNSHKLEQDLRLNAQLAGFSALTIYIVDEAGSPTSRRSVPI